MRASRPVSTSKLVDYLSLNVFENKSKAKLPRAKVDDRVRTRFAWYFALSAKYFLHRPFLESHRYT